MVIKNSREHRQFYDYVTYSFLKEKDFMKKDSPLYLYRHPQCNVLIIHGIDGCVLIKMQGVV